MPRIPDRLKRHEWQPHQPWPGDCVVQWGENGLVLSKAEGGSYTTAFVEAFPAEKAGGFIRGEGENLDVAEANAFAKFERQFACEHRWGRGKYTNGGAICCRCKGFQTVFKPIVTLGDCLKPASLADLSHALEGMVCPSEGDDRRTAMWRRRMWLRVRRLGIEIPAPVPRTGWRLDTQWEEDSKRAVKAWLVRNGLESLEEGGEHFLEEAEDWFARRHLQRVLEDA